MQDDNIPQWLLFYLLFDFKATSVFTTDGSVNVGGHVSASGVGRNNTAAVYDDLPPSYNDVILTSDSPTVNVSAQC